jgi:hypothetical protein
LHSRYAFHLLFSCLQLLGRPPVTVFWPLAACMIIAGLIVGWGAGVHLLTRALSRKPGGNCRGLFVWSLSFLSYGFMCIGGFFYHCLHIAPVFQVMDVTATGLSSMSAMAGFAAFSGTFDDRTLTQRLIVLAFYPVVAFAAVIGPVWFREQLYLIPSFHVFGVGFKYIRKCGFQARRAELGATQQAAFKAAKAWLLLGSLGICVGLASLFADKWCCVHLGAHFNILWWIFLGSNLAMFTLYRFILIVDSNKLQFKHVKSQ